MISYQKIARLAMLLSCPWLVSETFSPLGGDAELPKAPLLQNQLRCRRSVQVERFIQVEPEPGARGAAGVRAEQALSVTGSALR